MVWAPYVEPGLRVTYAACLWTQPRVTDRMKTGMKAGIPMGVKRDSGPCSTSPKRLPIERKRRAKLLRCATDGVRSVCRLIFHEALRVYSSSGLVLAPSKEA